MKRSCLTIASLIIVTLAGGGVQAWSAVEPASGNQGVWRGVHLMSPGKQGLAVLKKGIDEGLRPLGVNVIVLELNYGFQFPSHPELADPHGLSREDARDLAAFCRDRQIRLIPQLNCLGHQSWARNTQPLLTKYPQFDETPQVPADNKGIYCRSWCPLHPEVNRVVFALIDDLIDAFQADAFHVGMDEVFLVASDQCPRCKGKNPADVFAKAVNDLHAHIVQDRKLTMLMWADRLLDDKTMHYGKWESSANGTAPAIDQIPHDIILCDWHYELSDHYPSVPYLQEKGFRVWPASWNNPKAALALLEDSKRVNRGGVIGHLGTTWGSATAFCKAITEPAVELPKGRRAGVQGAAQALRVCLKALNASPAAASDEFPKGQWTSLFNGKDLSGWTPKLKGYALGDNAFETFRVQDGVLKVSYDGYKDFHGEFGHLFYQKPFSHYRLRVEYRFVGDQVHGGPGWAFRNSGAMIHCQPPETMRKDQEFPVSIEVQFLGGSGRGKRPTANLCTPGTHIVMNGKLITTHCIESKSKTFNGDQWVTVEAEVHGSGTIKHFVNGEPVIEYERPQLDGSDPDAVKLTEARKGERLITGGYISLQAESHPVEFRKVEIMPLEE